MRRVTGVLLGAVCLLPLAAGCGADSPAPAPTTDSPTPAPTTDSPAGTAPVVDPAQDPPPFPRGTARQTADSAGEQDLVLTDVRAAAHDGFDRVVLEFSGAGRPGWTVNYVDRAVMDGSGEVVDLAGGTVLDVYASGTTWPAPGYYSGPTRVDPADGGDVRDLYVAGTFEGYTQVLAGIEGGQVPFRAFALTDPPRLVVDVDN